MSTFIGANSGSSNGSSTSAQVTSNLTINPGDLIAIFCKWEGASGATPSVTDNAGNTYNQIGSTIAHSNGDLYGAWFYAIHAGSTITTLTNTLTLSAARPWKIISHIIGRPGAGLSFIFDQHLTAQGTTASAGEAISYGSISNPAAGFYVACFNCYGTVNASQPAGFTSRLGASLAQAALTNQPTGAGTVTGSSSLGSSGLDYIRGLTGFYEGSATTTPTITNADDEVFYPGETGIPITGTGFKATQGTGKVYISPTNNAFDASRVEQTVTTWSDTSITFTCVKGALSYDTNYYLFVINSDDQPNATGYVVQITPRVFIRHTFKDKAGAVRSNETGLTVIVNYSVPTAGSPNPGQVLVNQSLDVNGLSAWEINRGALALNDPVWITVMKDGSPAIAFCGKVAASYE